MRTAWLFSCPVKMPIWLGRYRAGRQPQISFQLAGTKGHPEEIVATIDTGFSGFLMISGGRAMPHGLEAVGTTNATMADGRRMVMETARASVGYAGCTRTGIAIISPQPCDCLVGVDFLRRFDLVLVMSYDRVCLVGPPESQRLLGVMPCA